MLIAGVGGAALAAGAGVALWRLTPREGVDDPGSAFWSLNGVYT